MADELDPRHTHDATLRRIEAVLAHEGEQRAAHARHMAEMDAIREQQQETIRRLDALAADPSPLDTTVTRVRRMAERQTHPTWMHAAYADLAQRIARVDERLDELEASMSLLHTKMEMLIGQLAAQESQSRAE